MVNLHLSERDMLLAADGELPARRKAQVTAHLETCWSCRERMQSLEGTIAEFIRARNRELDEQLLSCHRTPGVAAGTTGGGRASTFAFLVLEPGISVGAGGPVRRRERGVCRECCWSFSPCSRPR